MASAIWDRWEVRRLDADGVLVNVFGEHNRHLGDVYLTTRQIDDLRRLHQGNEVTRALAIRALRRRGLIRENPLRLSDTGKRVAEAIEQHLKGTASK